MTLLDDAPDGLELPADRARPTRLGSDLDTVTTRLGPAVAAGVERLASESGVEVPAAMLGLWQAVLVRHVDEADLVMGCTPPDRPAAASDTWLIVRSTVDPSCSFLELVKLAGEAWAEAAGRPTAMTELLDALGIEPGPGKHPVFQVALDAATEPPGTTCSTLFQHGPPCDLTLQWHRGPDGLDLALLYTPQLFDRRRIERLLTRLQVLLEAALAEPDRPVAELDLLPADEVEQLWSWNRTEHPHDEGRGVADLFADQAARTPEAVAVESEGRSLSYRQLDERANRLADILVERGVGPDETVAVAMERSIAMVVAVLAILKAGGAYVPIDPAYPESRRRYMVDQAGVRLVLADGTGMASGFDDGEVEVVDAGDGATDVLLAGRPATPPQSQATGAHLGYVIFTSGSTGQPKGVALPQRALTNLVDWQLRRADFEPGVRTLQFASLSFDVSFQEIFTTWCSGGTLVLIDDRTRRDPRGLLDHLRSERVGRVFLPFVALRGLADAAAASGSWPTELREVYTAGEQLVVDDTVRRFFAGLPGCLLENQYGPSESHVVTAHRLTGEPDTWPTLPPIGGPIANSTTVVLDRAGRLRPIGVPGELFLGGTCLAREYLGRPDLTAERFVERAAVAGQRFYRTGDLARWSEDGVLEFLGRIDHQVKFRGFRIEPGEVASVLSRFAGVRQCVASVVDLEGVGARLAAYVVPRDGHEVVLHELHAYARDNLPDYMVPSHYVVLDALPMTPSGKVDTAGLPRPDFDRGILANPYVAPNTPIQWALAEIWQDLLGVDEVGRYDDFFELGGDSLMAVELFLRIGERFDADLPLGALAQAPTIDGLSQLLERVDDDETWEPLVLLNEGSDDKTPLFCVHGGSGNIASLPKLARALPADQPVYALQWDGLRGEGGARTIEAMADRYLAELRRIQPHGPYLLAGQCIGGLVAREMAARLLGDGEDVGLLAMYESPNVATRNWRVRAGFPPLPAPVAPLLLRLLSAVMWVVHLAKARVPRRQLVLTTLRDVAGRRIPVDDRAHFGARAMAVAAWRYQPRPVPVRTLYVHTGLRNAGSIALTGTWTDGMLGWSDFTGDGFEVVRVTAGHNAVPYAPDALAALNTELDRFHAGRTTAGP